MSANSSGKMYYRCLEVTHEWLSDGSFEDKKARKRKDAICHVQKFRRLDDAREMTWTLIEKRIFLHCFPLDNWKCCFRSLGTFIVRKVIEMMSLQVLLDRVVGGEPQHLDWTIWEGNFHVASRIVILISMLTICEFFRNSGNPVHHMLAWSFYVTSVLNWL